MAKPKIQSRIDPNVEERIDNFAEQNGMSQSEAVRHLLRTGIDTETGELSTDGGEMIDRFDRFEEAQSRRDRAERVQNMLLAAVIPLGVYVVLSDVGLAMLLITLALALALIGSFIYPELAKLRRSTDSEQGPQEAEA